MRRCLVRKPDNCLKINIKKKKNTKHMKVDRALAWSWVLICASWIILGREIFSFLTLTIEQKSGDHHQDQYQELRGPLLGSTRLFAKHFFRPVDVSLSLTRCQNIIVAYWLFLVVTEPFIHCQPMPDAQQTKWTTSSSYTTGKYPKNQFVPSDQIRNPRFHQSHFN